MKDTNTLIENISRKIVDDSINIWVGSPFEFLQRISPDERGKWGESILSSLISNNTDYCVIWNGDKNTNNSDGSIYDMLISNYRTETKTATKGSKKDFWQHDNLYEENKWDKVVFIDVDLYGIYFTIQNHSDIPFNKNKHAILNKVSTRHLSAWKFDLSRKQLNILEKNGVTFYYDWITPDETGLINFLKNGFC